MLYLALFSLFFLLFVWWLFASALNRIVEADIAERKKREEERLKKLEQDKEAEQQILDYYAAKRAARAAANKQVKD